MASRIKHIFFFILNEIIITLWLWGVIKDFLRWTLCCWLLFFFSHALLTNKTTGVGFCHFPLSCIVRIFTQRLEVPNSVWLQLKPMDEKTFIHPSLWKRILELNFFFIVFYSIDFFFLIATSEWQLKQEIINLDKSLFLMWELKESWLRWESMKVKHFILSVSRNFPSGSVCRHLQHSLLVKVML